jgi:pectate lyase-like protein
MATVALSYLPIQPFLSNNGLPLVGGQLFSFQAGTSTPAPTYTDNTGTVNLPNPIILNARGEVATSTGASSGLWIPPNTGYKFVLEDALGNTIWAIDQVFAPVTNLGAVAVNVIPSITNTYNIGSPSLTWANGYFGTSVNVAGVPVPTYPQTAAELAAGVTPTNYVYPQPDLRRYGAKIDGTTDDTTAINNAIKVARASGGPGYIYHPGGTCVHASQILSGGGYGVLGFDRAACIFSYTGSASSSSWRITNNGTSSPTPNSSGVANWYIDGVTITTAIGSSTAAGLEINACGYAYYDIKGGARITGTFKWGVIWDGAEVASIQPGCIIDNAAGSAIANAANVWVVNGADRTATQNSGYTNRVMVSGAQLNVNGTGVTSYNILDDGGAIHAYINCNLNGASVPMRVASVEGLKIDNLEIENGLTAGATGLANLVFADTTAYASTGVNPCQGFEVTSCIFGADQAAGATILFSSAASAMHQGGRVSCNWFRNNYGRSDDIDVTKASNCWFGPNYVQTSAGGTHYTGTHNDANGNVQLPPQNGSATGFVEAAYLFGDNRYGIKTYAGLGVFGNAPPSQVTGFGTPVGGAVINNYNITDAGGANSNTNKCVAEILAILKAVGFIAT